MSRRILKTLALALVLSGVFAASAAAMRVTDPSIYNVTTSSHRIVSEKVAGLSAAPAVPAIVSDHGVVLRPAIVSDHGVLLRAPETRNLPVASGGNGLDWTDAGVGSAIAVAALLALSAVALGVRRRHLPLAH
jgi:hypothetical protein